MLDDRARAEASRRNPKIAQINDLHRAYVRQMHVDSCVAFLAMASLQDDTHFLSTEGDLKKQEISMTLRVNPETYPVIGGPVRPGADRSHQVCR